MSTSNPAARTAATNGDYDAYLNYEADVTVTNTATGESRTVTVYLGTALRNTDPKHAKILAKESDAGYKVSYELKNASVRLRDRDATDIDGSW